MKSIQFQSIENEGILFHQDNERLQVSLLTRQKLTAWRGSSDLSTVFTGHCTFRFLFISIFPKFSKWKNFNSLKDCKRHLERFFAQKDSLGKMELQRFLKNGRRQWNKMVNMLFNKVLVENEKMCLLLLLKKPKELFGQPKQHSKKIQNQKSCLPPCGQII